MASIVYPSNYYDRFSATYNYKKLLCRAGLGVQSAEFNEWQDNSHYELQTFGNVIYPDGTILSGGSIQNTGGTNYTVGACVFWAQGYTFQVPAFNYTIGSTESTVMGIYLTTAVIDETQDPSLRDPAVNTRNFNQPGCCRLQIEPQWAKQANVPSNTDFYPLITYVDGVQTSPSSPPGYPDSQWYNELAHYDYVAHNSYVINGLITTWVSDDNTNNQSILNISSGSAHVYGYEFTYNSDQRIRANWAMDSATVLNEPATFTANGNYTTRNGNLATVYNCFGTAQVASVIVHGSYTGCEDLLPNTPVQAILYVNQGGTWNGSSFSSGTNYNVTSDWVQDGNKINWAPAGSEPSPGSSYTVVYNYELSITATISSPTQIYAAGFLAGTTFYYSYTYYIPRIDCVVMNTDGSLAVLMGTSNALTPQPPQIGKSLSLAQLYMVYGAQPVITVDYYTAVPFWQIMNYATQIETNTLNIATLSLGSTLNAADPTSTKLGIFVDPLTSDVERDAGITQNAVTSSGGLIPYVPYTDLSVATGVHYILPYTTTVYLNQPNRTETTIVNTYTYTVWLPIYVKLFPKVFRFLGGISWWDRDDYYRVWGWQYGAGWAWFNGTYAQPWVPDQFIELCPQTGITVYCAGFGAGETVHFFFDDIDFYTYAAGSDGILSCVVTSPSWLISGKRVLKFRGATTGFIGSQIFQCGSFLDDDDLWDYWPEQIMYEIPDTIPSTYTTTVENVILITQPLSQVVNITDEIFIPSYNVWEETDTDTFVEHYIVDVDKTMFWPLPINCWRRARQWPYGDWVLNDDYWGHARWTDNNWTTVTYSTPYHVEPPEYVSFTVHTTEPSFTVALAKQGDTDIATGNKCTGVDGIKDLWQLSDATSNTWIKLDGMMLAIQVNKCVFSATSTTVLTPVTVTNATDLMLLTHFTLPTGTSVACTVTLLNRSNQVYTIVPYKPLPISLASPNDKYTGQVQISLTLNSSDPDVTPMVDGNITLSYGTVAAASTYVSRVILVPSTATNICVALDMYESTAGQVVVEYLHSDGTTWTALTRGVAISIGNGWVTQLLAASGAVDSGLKISGTRVRITENISDASARCAATNLRLYYT